MPFGERMKLARKNKGLSQKELASLLGLQMSTVSLYELNKREPKFDTIEQIAQILDVPTSWLFGQTDNKTKNELSHVSNNLDNTINLDSLLEIVLILKDWPDMVDILRRLGEKTTPEERRKIARIIKAAIIDTDDPPK